MHFDSGRKVLLVLLLDSWSYKFASSFSFINTFGILYNIRTNGKRKTNINFIKTWNPMFLCVALWNTHTNTIHIEEWINVSTLDSSGITIYNFILLFSWTFNDCMYDNIEHNRKQKQQYRDTDTDNNNNNNFIRLCLSDLFHCKCDRVAIWYCMPH